MDLPFILFNISTTFQFYNRNNTELTGSTTYRARIIPYKVVLFTSDKLNLALQHNTYSIFKFKISRQNPLTSDTIVQTQSNQQSVNLILQIPETLQSLEQCFNLFILPGSKHIESQ
ncbi:Hypothetical_protein [Hexamita inflata]|uniref:Hypothetical_protein n=1 Tax=Hexamita inflata TaxID=28002 RepID=A0AA86QKG1_9EUKA|nr:Hypothetical protein HINF_LOCUS45762 [Hexamita inflata]